MTQAILSQDRETSSKWWGCKYFRQAMAENEFQSLEFNFFQHNVQNIIQTNIPMLNKRLPFVLSTLFSVMKYHREKHSDGNDLCPSCLCLVWSNVQDDFQVILEAVVQHAQQEEYQWEQLPDPYKYNVDLVPDPDLIPLLKDYSEEMFGGSYSDAETDTHSERSRETPPPQASIKSQQQPEESKSDLKSTTSPLNQDALDKLSASQSSSSSPAPSLSSSFSPSLSEQRFQSAFSSNPPSLLLTQITNKKLLNQDRAYLQKSWNSWVDYAFDQHETPRKFKFENIDVIEPYGKNSVSISFFERPKKALLSFFARRLEKNRSCRIKMFSRKYSSTSGKSLRTTTPTRTSSHRRSPLSQNRRQSSYTPPKQPNSRFTPISNFQCSFSPPTHTQPTSLFHNHSNNSSNNSKNNFSPSFNLHHQTRFATQEQFAQIQSQLNFLTSLLTGCPCAPNSVNLQRS